MAPETELRERPRRPLPDLDGEQEVDLGRYWTRLVAHWWLVAVGFALGLVIGYLLSVGGSDVYQAKATVYLGQPLSPTGSTAVQSVATNTTSVRQVATAESTIADVARRLGMSPDELRGHISTSSVTSTQSRLGQTPLVTITVTGKHPRRVGLAATAIADTVVQRVSGYVSDKIRALRSQLRAENQALAETTQLITQYRGALSRGGLSSTDRLILAGQLNAQVQTAGQLTENRSQTESQLSFARSVESAQVLTRGAATKTTAQSRRNSVLVGGIIGLLLGVLAALLWEPAVRLVRRSRLT